MFRLAVANFSSSFRVCRQDLIKVCVFVVEASFSILVVEGSYSFLVVSVLFHILVVKASFHIFFVEVSFHIIVVEGSYSFLVVNVSFHILVLKVSFRSRHRVSKCRTSSPAPETESSRGKYGWRPLRNALANKEAALYERRRSLLLRPLVDCVACPRAREAILLFITLRISAGVSIMVGLGRGG